MDTRGLDDLFFLDFTCFWAENCTSADMMTLEEPVLLLRSENMVTLAPWGQIFKCKYREKAKLYRKKAIAYGEQKG